MSAKDLHSLFSKFGSLALSEKATSHTKMSTAAEPSKVAICGRRYQHHELKVHAPAIDRTPEGAEWLLASPKDVAFREHPNYYDFHLDTFSPEHVVYLGLTSGEQLSLHGSNTAADLKAAVCSITKAAGRSTIFAVQVRRREEVFTHIELESTFATPLDVDEGDAQTEHKMFDLSEIEWENLVQSPEPWVSLLEDLMTRSTDLAFLTVDKTLRNMDPDTREQDDMSLAISWRSQCPRSAKELFKHRLQPVDEMVDLDFLAESDGAVEVSMPCGHVVSVTAYAIINATYDDCIQQCCPECQRRILQTSDDRELALRQALQDRDDHRSSQTTWMNLELEVRDNWRQRVVMKHLLTALQQAAKSLTTPESAVPALLAPHCCEETATAIESIERWMTARPTTIVISPRKLYLELTTTVMDALRETDESDEMEVPNPPAWRDFLKTWLRRAINWVLVRSCEDEDHHGVHWHDDELFYSSVESSGDLNTTDDATEKSAPAQIRVDVEEYHEQVVRASDRLWSNDDDDGESDDTSDQSEWEDVKVEYGIVPKGTNISSGVDTESPDAQMGEAGGDEDLAVPGAWMS